MEKEYNVFEHQTSQGHKILEIWKGKNDFDEKSLFVIVEREHDVAWGSYYHLDTGNWEHGHYDYPDLASARLHMLNMYKEYKLDLIKKN